MYVWISIGKTITKASDGSVAVLAIALSLITYITYIVGLEKLLANYNLNRWSAMTCIVFAVFAGVTFTQTLHLTR